MVWPLKTALMARPKNSERSYGKKQGQLEGVITFMFNGVLALTMGEDWDDETPAWTVSEEPEYDPVQALKDLTPLAEFLMSSASSLSFKGVRTGVEFDEFSRGH